MTRPTRISLLAALVAAGVTVLVFSLVGGATSAAPPSGDPPLGAAVSEEDRRAVDAAPVQRGAPAPPAHPAVDPADPDAVARAYLAAAHSTAPDDAGRTSLRGAAYAVPGSPPATVGVVVVDPPPAGQSRTATVTALALVTTEPGDRRRAYRAEVGTATGPPGGSAVVDLVTRHVVLARQPDGRWLVAADSPATPELLAGED